MRGCFRFRQRGISSICCLLFVVGCLLLVNFWVGEFIGHFVLLLLDNRIGVRLYTRYCFR